MHSQMPFPIATLRLWLFLRMVRVMLKSDNVECEGVNSVVRDETTRSPHISLELLAARVSLKRQLSLGSSSKQWSVIKHKATAIADKCASYFEMANSSCWRKTAGPRPVLQQRCLYPMKRTMHGHRG